MPLLISSPIRLAAAAAVIAPLIRLPICTSIELTVFPAIHLSVSLTIFSPIELSVFTTILSAIHLTIFSPVFPSIQLPILLPISLAIFLSDIRLGKYHIRQDGWGCHGHDQTGYCSNCPQIALHERSSFGARE